ncbi:hypothetical protein ACE1MK_06600 [Tenacibaculum maritimum]|uniref:hypothetical protein n=1 Tax=Tenacibaculum maritimum TaxID=107401 RepID=UPI0012E4EF97|nr:hypothetical protein [Tenacibaculum maritimum]MCD9583326.1 hypothetical protein [Tenacibaculum maritimum]MCD9637390.1 hypothetical protein [Tenacibaculum maritimum]CAA0177306.1 conserved hypothetical protein [Tenacibaculum maritimum]CAA0229802.1 conserved hypothetical protein [Tenacibaculum maritimum]CAA0235096.1 conserved hypothetical protein [Tenacibaculum maritimum]
MKYVDLTEMIDYRPYLSYLETIKEELPKNTRDYATRKEHWDFSSEYCPHDYWLESLNFKNINNSEKFTLSLKFTTLKYQLILDYEKVIKYSFKVKNFENDFKMLGSQIVIDEIRIKDDDKNVIIHEIALNYGNLLIECSDMNAQWVEII